MTEITGGELFARALQAAGIEFLFGLPSPEVDALLVELKAHGIRLVPVRHEDAAVHMAEGLYKTTGKVAAVLVGNPGPGSANLLPGVVTALHEGVPVLVITSQHRLGIVYPSPPSTFQGHDQLDLFRPTVKWGGPVASPRCCAWPSARCGTGGPGRCTSSCRRRSSMPPGTCAAPVIAPAASRGTGPQASEAQLTEGCRQNRTASEPLKPATCRHLQKWRDQDSNWTPQSSGTGR
jgi:acetolactate synthase I/II/III large subunit